MVKKNVIVALMIFWGAQACYAASCMDMFEDGNTAYQNAIDAFNAKDFSTATTNFKMAAYHYDKVMNSVSCDGRIKAMARKNHDFALKNSKISGDNVGVHQENTYNKNLYEIFKEAEKHYRMGKQFALVDEWDQAVEAFDTAEKLWREVARNGEGQNKEAAKNNAILAHRALLSAKNKEIGWQ